MSPRHTEIKILGREKQENDDYDQQKNEIKKRLAPFSATTTATFFSTQVGMVRPCAS
jgi:hypothetical protein